MFENVNVPGPPIDMRIDANTFELKTWLIQMVQLHPFVGRATEDPNRHLCKFMEISNTTKHNEVPEDKIKLRLFPFSLIDDTKDLYESLAPGSIISWQDLAHRFLDKFLPYSSNLKLQAEISHFSMMSQESIYEAWKRFKALLRKCPNHGIGRGYQVSIFYNGCTDQIKSQLDFVSGGSFLDLVIEACERMLNKLAGNSKGWNSGRDSSIRVAAATDIDPIDIMSKQLVLMNQKMDDNKLAQLEPQVMIEDVNCVHQGGHQRNYNNCRPNHESGNYQANCSHPNLSYGNPNNALQPPPGFSVTNGAINEPNTASPSAYTDELLRAFMGRTQSYKELLSAA